MALKVLSALETSKITVPTPSATTDAATKGYVDDNASGVVVEEATTTKAGVVVLADISNTGSNNEGKVPTLNNVGKLYDNVIPTNITSVVTGSIVNTFGGESGNISIDSKFLKLDLVGVGSDQTYTLTIAYDSRYLQYESGLGLSLKSSVQTTLTNATHPYYMCGSDNNSDNGPITYNGTHTTVRFYSPDTYVPLNFGSEELPDSNYLISQESIAPVFVSGTTYSEDQLVSYSGWLYRCVVSTSTFDPTQDYDMWERITICDNKGRLNVLNNNKQRLTQINVTNAAAKALTDNKNGWMLVVSDNSSNIAPSIKLPSVTTLKSNETVTYEMIVRCLGGSSSGTFKPKFQDSGGTVIDFLGANPKDDGLERGYNHFLVFRNFPSDSNNTRQWVGNIQGKVPLPS